ncbi:midkine a [Electrophorus electricus]|uniref:Midkine n=1 Tax=Electrophorus electricus TaxID=8005 RepID=A0AAY5EQI5_ELEEL|nr:midkine a [Electrophorus electricus]
MRGLCSTLFLLLVALMIVTTEAGKHKKEKGKRAKGKSDCTEWSYGNCMPNKGNCGPGLREGTCDDQTRKQKCKVPCNWKKQFGVDCKYKFDSWGECDATTHTKIRTGILLKVFHQAECQKTITVSKPCSTKSKSKGNKGKRRGN